MRCCQSMEEGENSFPLLFAILGFEPRAPCMPDKCSTASYISSPSIVLEHAQRGLSEALFKS